MTYESLNTLPLGKKVSYKCNYDASLLQSIPRIINRQEFNKHDYDFYGFDCWNLYELSWLNLNGMPQVAIGEVYIPCASPNLIESKSFKLYLNSFNQTCFSDWSQVTDTIIKDLSKSAGVRVNVFLHQLNQAPHFNISKIVGINLDEQDLLIKDYSLDNNLLKAEQPQDKPHENDFHEILYSNLLKSNCLITHQPDWGSIIIDYIGTPIAHNKLLRYLISFRLHNEFHEQCVERIYSDIQSFYRPKELSVYARYTRRGGLDINPYRSSKPINIQTMRELNTRLVRQ